MRTIAHLSDPHFGRIEPATVQALIATIIEARPDVVVVSGDLTQRAKEREFQEARQFQLPSGRFSQNCAKALEVRQSSTYSQGEVMRLNANQEFG